MVEWSELSDLDKGAALLHLWKCENEGRSYAEDNYPARFIEDPRLVELSPEDACAQAQHFATEAEDLPPEEWTRLYDLALDQER